MESLGFAKGLKKFPGQVVLGALGAPQQGAGYALGKIFCLSDAGALKKYEFCDHF